MVSPLAAASAAVEGTPMEAEVLPPIPGRVLHLDGDYLAYWTGVIEDAGTARTVALNKIEKLQQLSRSERTVVHLTDDASSKADRRIIAEVKPYQAQRGGKGKPVNWAFMRQYLSAMRFGDIVSKTWGSREADDGIAYCAYMGEPIAIASKDKDMRMLPGVHINWDDFSCVTVPPGAYDVVGPDGKQYGLKWFWLQCLHGDTADNIPGLPKYLDGKTGKYKQCGEAAAKTILSGCKSSLEAGQRVAQEYELYYGGGWQRKLVEQMLLLWLRTDRDASVLDLRQVLPLPNDDELWYFIGKIKETYEQAQALGSCARPPDDT